MPEDVMSSCRARSDMVETLFVPGKPMQHREADTLLVSLPSSQVASQEERQRRRRRLMGADWLRRAPCCLTHTLTQVDMVKYRVGKGTQTSTIHTIKSSMGYGKAEPAGCDCTTLLNLESLIFSYILLSILWQNVRSLSSKIQGLASNSRQHSSPEFFRARRR